MTSSISSAIDADGVCTITWDLADSPVNKINANSLKEFEAALKSAVENEKVRGIILASAKEDFIVGADLAMLTGMRDRPVEQVFQEVMQMHQLLRYMETCKKPVVAALTGSAFGGGLEIALACHHRVMADSPKAKLGFPEVKVGIFPGGGGTQRLPRLVKLQEALKFLTEGRNASAQEALKDGMVHVVVPSDKVLAEAKKYIVNGGSAEQPWDQKGFRLPSGEIQSPKGAETFAAGNALLRKTTHGNYPGPAAILECVYHGLQLDIMEGLTFEARKFVHILRSDTARNMIRTMFYSMNDANKLKDRPEGFPKHKVEKVGILGAGLMGSGIAYASASSGIEVVLIDSAQELADKGKAAVQKIVEKQVSKGQLSPEKGKQIVERVDATTNYDKLKGCSLLIEAVFENREVKAEVTKKADAILPDDAVIASNTSTIPITLLGEAAKNQESFIGIHFFSPVDKMPLVEVIRSKKTNDETLAKALDYVQQIKKTPIVVNDSRGFYTSRCFATYTSEGIAMLAEGIPAALIENVGRMAGMPMGPLEVADMVGLDVMEKVTEQTRKDLGGNYHEDPSFAIVKTLVLELKRLGQKNGKGFYDYGEKGQKKLWTGLAERYPESKSLPTVEEMKERLLMIQAIETIRCLEERVVLKPADADIGSVLGWGFCPFYGGVISYVDTIGSKVLYDKASAFAERFGPRFSPPTLLKELAGQNKKFYDHVWQSGKERVAVGKA
jgi:3-hydroxyacyl-CoA dehydrogenase / enoyl-CoA hydratase / 3-hydroxybutyryl-CoA epimerase